ncbi:MAG: hypothetical protein JWN78_3132 [Bacteroidota bacterium]|nr:hypothetical protein [Bacteroidota bacterium]
MKLSPIILAGIAGTTAMTLFSYAVSKIQHRNFKEPQLLGKLIHRVAPVEKKNAEKSGWLLHYATGIIFASVYYQVLKKTNVEPTVLNGLLIGGLSGIPAVGIWYAVLKLHPYPPKRTFKNYFGHLIAAHVIFGAFTFMAYASEEREINNEVI